MRNVNPLRKLYNKIAQRLGKLDDFFYIGAGAMCDMAWVVHGPITGKYPGDGYIHYVDGKWVFNREMFDDHFRRYADEGMRLHRTALCVGGDAPRKDLFMPWGFVPSRDAFDLSVYVEDWFVVFEAMVDRWNHWGITPIICLKNECDKRSEARRLQSPYYHNVNGGRELYDAVAIKYDKIFVDKLLTRLKGKDFLVELINEGHERRGGAVEWCQAIIPILYKHDIAPTRISLGADVVDYKFTGIGKPGDRLKNRWDEYDGLENYDLIMHALVVEYEKEKKYTNVTHEAFYVSHSFGEKPHDDFPEQTPFGTRTQYTTEAWTMHNCFSNRVFDSTDGTDHADTPGGRPSPKRMKAAILYVLRSNPAYKKLPYVSGGAFKYIFDYLPQKQKADDVVLAIRAMAEAHREFFGTWPKNRGQYPPVDPVPPPPEPPEPPTPPEPEPPTPEPPTPPAPEPEPEPEPKPAEPWYSWNRIRNVRRWTWQAWLTVAAIVIFCVLIF